MICSSLAPSTRAASTSSPGIVRKNCRNRKIENASPKNAGTISGLSEPIQCSLTKIRYSGTIVTCVGSIIVAITNRKTAR